MISALRGPGKQPPALGVRHLLSFRDFVHDAAALVRAVEQATQRNFSLRPLPTARPFRYQMAVVHLGEVMVARLQTSPIEVSQGVSHAPEDTLILEIPNGPSRFQAWHGEHGVDVGPGEALISLGRLARRNRTDRPLDLLILQLPLRPWLPLPDAFSRCPLRLLPAGIPGLQTLGGSMLGLLEDGLLNDAPTLYRIGAHLQDLSKRVVREVWPLDAALSLAACRRHAAQTLIADRLSSPELSEEEVAQELGVSSSTLRKLFVCEGGFGRYVRRMRLHSAWAMLQDPAAARIKVIDVAASCGFNDISTFNRQFKRAYRVSPSELRRCPDTADNRDQPQQPAASGG